MLRHIAPRCRRQIPIMRHFLFNAPSPAATGPARLNTSWRWLLLACVLLAVPASAASLKGEAVYRERILPPPEAIRVVNLEDPARRDAPDPCADVGTQAAMGECAHQNFLTASAAMSAQLQQLESALKPGQRTTWRRVQKAWLTYRTQACHFESSQLETGSMRTMVQWQCAARMTRERVVELSRLSACREGDTACLANSRPGKKRLSIFSRRR